MTTERRIKRVRRVAWLLAAAALVLFSSAFAQAQADGGSGLEPLVPWAVGVIGVLCLYLLRLSRDIEKDFTAVKARHTELLAMLEKQAAGLHADLRVYEEALRAVPDQITASRHKTAGDFGARFLTLEDRVMYLERARMDATKGGSP